MPDAPEPPPLPRPMLEYVSRPPERWSPAARRAAVNGCLTSVAWFAFVVSITFLLVIGIHAWWASWHG